ncbi:hypothetical protein IAU60_005630 [Kwoniella sp. DSM 27419]
MIVPLILIASVAWAQSAKAAAYLGCISAGNVPAATTSSPGGTLEQCLTFCSGSSYAYYVTSTSACTCSNTGASNQQFVAATNANGACAAADAAEYFYGASAQLVGCGTGVSGSDSLLGSADTAEECFDFCAQFDSTSAAFSRIRGTDNTCVCGTGFTTPRPATCTAFGTNGYYIYNLTPAPQATSNTRRKLKERAALAQANRNQYCPAGLTACAIDGHQESFECVDSSSDLESCGGCIDGMYGVSNVTGSGVGQDCSAIPGVALGGVTCTRGRCNVSACKKGYALVGHGCVPVY